MAKSDPTGRSKGEVRHTRLPHNMTGSAAWRDLSGNAMKLLVALQRLDHGGNNGNLYLSVRKASEETGMSLNTVSRGFHELEEHGFIIAMDRGHFQVKGGPASRWRITFLSAPYSHLPASNDWQRWQPNGKKTRSQNLTRAVSNIETPRGNVSKMVAEIDTAPLETPLVSVERGVSKTATQVYCHGQGVTEAVSNTSKQGGNTAGQISVEQIGNDALAQMRDRLRAYLDASPIGTQSKLAADTDIPGGSLSKFLGGRGLNRTHLVKLQVALRRLDTKRAA